MSGRQNCIGCGRVSPETNGEITLTTSFGWRIRRNMAVSSDGQTEWRCPACWQRFKATQAAGAVPGDLTSVIPPSSGPKDSRGPKG